MKNQSKQLLEIAKTGVEKVIATDEATATAWINQQLETLGIKIHNLDVAMEQAIAEGETTELVSREAIFQLLEPQG